jgi:hypothetical protein
MHMLALLVSLCALPPAGHPLALQQSGSDTLVGTVRALDLRQGGLTVTTGVGMALRVVRLRIGTETRAAEAGAALPLSALKPGDVVRVVGGTRPDGRVAYTVERVAPAPAAAP